MAFEAGAVVARFKADTADFEKGVRTASAGLGKFAKQSTTGLKALQTSLKKTGETMQKIGGKMSLFITTPIVGLGVAGLKAAMDMEQTNAKFETVFKGMTEEADAFIRKFQQLTPATRAEARSMASGIQDLLIPMGVAREDATRMTGEFMHVAGALQSFNSGTHTTQMVMTAMNAALTGSFEPLKSLGIQLDVTTARQKAVEMGLAETTDQVDKQALAQVALAEIYAQSGDALEAYTEESLDAGTKLGLLRSRVLDTASALFTQMIPTLHRLIDVINQGVAWFDRLSQRNKNIILVVLGVIATIGPLILIIGTLLKSIATIISVGLFLTKVLGGITVAVKALTIAKMIMFAKVMLVIGIISAFVAGLIWLGKNSHIVRANLASAWNGIVATVASAYHQIRSWVGSIINTVQSIGHHIWAVAGNIFNAIISPFQRAYNFIAGIFRNVGNLVSGAVNKIPAGVRRFIPGFADGGIVGGSSFTGDRVLAAVNSGEMILNRQQQSQLFDMINTGGTGGGISIANVNIADRQTADYFLQALDDRQRLAKLGVR